MSDFNLRKPTRKEFKEFTNTDELVYILEYKNERFPIFDDAYGSQCYTIIDDKVYGGGAFNINYIEDFKYLILEREKNK